MINDSSVVIEQPADLECPPHRLVGFIVVHRVGTYVPCFKTGVFRSLVLINVPNPKTGISFPSFNWGVPIKLTGRPH